MERSPISIVLQRRFYALRFRARTHFIQLADDIGQLLCAL
jgi:hypothetical protein